MTKCCMDTSRSSSVRAAGLSRPFPVSAAPLRTPALWPVGPRHYAKLPQYEGEYNKTEVPLLPMGLLASRLHQLVKRLWQTWWQKAVESKISAMPDLPPPLARLLVVSQYATIPKRTLSHPLSQRGANDNTQDVTSSPQTLSAFRTIESLLKAAADALREAKDLANSTNDTCGYDQRIGAQVDALEDEILPEIRAAVALFEAEVRP